MKGDITSSKAIVINEMRHCFPESNANWSWMTGLIWPRQCTTPRSSIGLPVYLMYCYHVFTLPNREAFIGKARGDLFAVRSASSNSMLLLLSLRPRPCPSVAQQLHLTHVHLLFFDPYPQDHIQGYSDFLSFCKAFHKSFINEFETKSLETVGESGK